MITNRAFILRGSCFCAMCTLMHLYYVLIENTSKLLLSSTNLETSNFVRIVNSLSFRELNKIYLGMLILKYKVWTAQTRFAFVNT